MEDKLLAAALYDRGAFASLEGIQAAASFSDLGKIIFKALAEYYHKDPLAAKADPVIIKERLARQYPKKADLFRKTIQHYPEVSIPNIIDEAMACRRQNIKEQLSAAFANGGDEAQIAELLQAYQQCKQGATTHDGSATSHHNKSIVEILDKASSAAKIKVYPKAITEATRGGLLRGHHLLFFARPDAGKTTMAITMTYGFIKQGLKVLYIGNEDPIDDIILRFLTRLLRVSSAKIEANQEAAQYRADKRKFKNFYPVEMYPGTITEIEQHVQDIQPDILIVDQAVNIKIKARSEVEQLKLVEREIRRLGKQYDMITISLAQAGDSADGRLVLRMNDVDGSNTGMQASADIMVGMGVNDEYERQGRRMLSFPKNKLGDKQHRQVEFISKYALIR